MAQTVQKWLIEILKKNTFLHYRAYYQVIRHNHNPQGIIAFARLYDCQDTVEQYVKTVQDMVPLYKQDEPSSQIQEKDFIQSSKMEDYLGKSQAYYKLLNMFMERYKTKYNGNINSMIKDECPSIIDGPIYGAFHGIIQMAYGLVSHSDQMVIEGIAWMYQQYSPLFIDDPGNPKRTDLTLFGKGKTSLEETLGKLRDENLVKEVQEGNRKDLQLRKDTNMFGVYGWSGPKYHSNYFMDVTNDLMLPEWFNPADRDVEQIKKLLDWTVDIATVLYVQCNTVNDFFTLHGITASWSAKQVLPLLDYDSALLGIRGTISGILMVYVQQNSPGLDKKPEDYFDGAVDQTAWDKLIKEIVTNDYYYESHIYKVVQCLYNRWQENPNSEYAKYYLAGSYAAKDNGYSNFQGKTNAADAFD